MKLETEYLNRIFGKNIYFGYGLSVEIYHTNINYHCFDADNQKLLRKFDKSGHN